MSDALPSTKPYLVRAIHEWCSDNGFTPYVSVVVDHRTVVPREHVKDGQIVLNIGLEATGRLQITNDALQCTARFNGVSRDLWVPMDRILAIYARENGTGMGFEVEEDGAVGADALSDGSASTQAAPVSGKTQVTPPDDSPDRPQPPARPRLQRVK